MLTDAHCHPYDFQEHKQTGVLAAASACTLKEFIYNEKLPDVLPCFGIHPQFFAQRTQETQSEDILEVLEKLAQEKRLAAVGECGFDLYSDEFKETEILQEKFFALQLDIVLKYDLPIVLHVRRAMSKLSIHIKKLAKCKAVVFHSWPGTYDEALYFLRYGVNVYFSFGNIVMLNHKRAIKCCSLLPAERLLTETDMPYAPRQGEKNSSWNDLPLILETIAALRSEAGNKIDTKELETQIEINFKNVFI